MSEQQKYVIYQDIKYSFLELIDIPKLIEDCPEKWYNQTLTRVNDCVVRLGVFKEGEFHWHKHDLEDEFFLVLQGKLIVELKNDSVILEPHQGYTVPRGTIHRPKVLEPTAILMVESSGVKPIGD